MPNSTSLYWFTRCDRCRLPITAHAMSVADEDLLCMACLMNEAAEIATRREAERNGSGRLRQLEFAAVQPRPPATAPSLATASLLKEVAA
jgi:recombinational DNA repair protein (RecF pathway)